MKNYLKEKPIDKAIALILISMCISVLEYVLNCFMKLHPFLEYSFIVINTITTLISLYLMKVIFNQYLKTNTLNRAVNQLIVVFIVFMGFIFGNLIGIVNFTSFGLFEIIFVISLWYSVILFFIISYKITKIEFYNKDFKILGYFNLIGVPIVFIVLIMLIVFKQIEQANSFKIIMIVVFLPYLYILKIYCGIKKHYVIENIDTTNKINE